MARRRSPKVVWLPPTNANSLGTNTTGYQIFSVDAAGGTGSFAVGEIPLTIDSQSDPLAAESSLSDVEDSGYRLRRVVGKIFISAVQNSDPAVTPLIPSRFLVTAGLIVRRSDDTTGKSLAALTADAELLGPGEIRNYGDPWIWRRSWILYNLGIPRADNQIFNDQGPTNNYTFGSGGIQDGPHVDAKTARIVGPEERLFLDVSSTVLVQSADNQGGEFSPITVVTDLRILASMRTTVGNRRNASR